MREESGSISRMHCFECVCVCRDQKETKVPASSSVEKLRSINDGDRRRCARSEDLQGAIATMWKENVNVGQLDKNEKKHKRL